MAKKFVLVFGVALWLAWMSLVSVATFLLLLHLMEYAR